MELSKNKWYKNDDRYKTWWYDNRDEQVGVFLFSFDKEKVFNLFADYPYKLTREEKKIFDDENPFWAKFFKNRG